MDGDERRRQQYAAPYQVPGATRSMQAPSMPPPSAERFVQPSQSPARSDVPRTALSRPYHPDYAGYSYQEQSYGAPAMHSSSPMQGVEMQYTPGYVQDHSREQQMQQQSAQQQYTSYGQNVMLQSSPTHAMYDPVPHFQQRQAAAVEVLSNQFGVPPYLPSSGHSAAGVPTPQSQYVTSQAEQQVYAQDIPTNRPSIAQSYATASTEYPIYEQQEVQDTQEAEAAQNTLNEGVRQYQDQLKVALGSIRAGRVNEASEKVSDVTRWLLGSVVALDLHHDTEKPEEHETRIELWRELNLCWEALGQTQKDITEDALRTRRQPADILSADTIHKMVDELISLCDQIEQHGLVDYDMGVWEEQIVSIFSQCLDLLPSEEGAGQSLSSTVGLSGAP